MRFNLQRRMKNLQKSYQNKESKKGVFMRYTYNKLVRDRIPENINKKPGKTCKYKILNDDEYLKELNRKVIEEANEFIEENSIEELGDLIEVIKAIMEVKCYSVEQIKEAMENKRDIKGAFSNKIYLEYVEEE